MFNKIKEYIKKAQFEELVKQYKNEENVANCNNEYFLNYLFNEMKNRMVQVSYEFGIITMKKQINGDQIVMEYPLIEIKDWRIQINSLRCSVEKRKNESLLIIETEWVTPTPEQRVTITF